MVFTKNLIIVCDKSTVAAAEAFDLPTLQLCIRIAENGTLYRTQLATAPRKTLLGIAELPATLSYCKAEQIAEDLLFEAQQTKAVGIFADFERNTLPCRQLVSALDRTFAAADIPFYVPYACRNATEHAILTIDTAITGGSLVERVSSVQGAYGTTRIAVFLRSVSNDFTLPSRSPDGTALSVADREALLEQTGSTVFFSRELCAKYFTYTDAEGCAHFVLFDDPSTLQAKLAQLSGCGVGTVFVLSADVNGLMRAS